MSFLSRALGENKRPVNLNVPACDSGIKHLEALTDRLDELELASFNHFEILNLVVDTLDISIWGKDQHGRFVFLNKTCADAILHSTVEAALNMTDKDFENDMLAKVCIYSDQKVMDSMKSKRFIEHASYKTGPMWLDTTKSPWVRNGNLIGTVGSARIITHIVPNEILNKCRQPESIEIDDCIVLCDETLLELLK